MLKINKLYFILFVLVIPLLITGCGDDTSPAPFDLGPGFFDKDIEEANSVVNELTPIVTIGDEVTVPVYQCNVDLDCDRCHNGDVYGQVCSNGTCQGDLRFLEECPEDCSVGECVENDDILTGEEVDGLVGEDYDLNPKGEDDDAIVDNDDLLPEPDGTQCSNSIESCIGYRGIGSAYLTDYPACECKLIYVPAGCSPMDPPCPDFSTKTDYPACECR
ncbi:hypothetical protein HON36_05580 [Candidatus Parcubacteria bacterium]|jgi:hypothetical protein|nr:hypothetical protein [Candidatus Parcubacteria bacterium]MBT7227929.1 hypothetical protein [Candidatus Parcubacteria bacterium]